MKKNWIKFISSNPKILLGKPVIKGTRISVELILEKLSAGESIEQILESYPQLTRKSVMACLAYASDSVKNEIAFALAG
jgi:uncharacterized protein (DUF433 family)